MDTLTQAGQAALTVRIIAAHDGIMAIINTADQYRALERLAWLTRDCQFAGGRTADYHRLWSHKGNTFIWLRWSA